MHGCVNDSSASAYDVTIASMAMLSDHSSDKSSFAMQMGGLLRGEAEIGGDFCGLVVDLAVEVANNAALASFNAARSIGLQSATLLHQDIFLMADTACTAAYRGMQQLLDEEVLGLNSSFTIDLSAAAAAEEPSGTPLPRAQTM
jgi:hypothetical protein